MQNLQNDPIHRNADRRSEERRTKIEKRRVRAKVMVNIKIALLWLLYAVVVFGFLVAMEIVLPYRIILKWILIFSFVGASAPAVYDVEKEIKKSLRHCNAEKGQTK